VTLSKQGHFTGIPYGSRSSYKTWVRAHDPCAYCGKFHFAQVFTFDHFHPKSKGGRDWSQNRVVACYECNHKKGCRTALVVLLERHHEQLSGFVRGCMCRICQSRRDAQYRRQNRVVRRLFTEVENEENRV
jgi:hypothetical protein